MFMCVFLVAGSVSCGRVCVYVLVSLYVFIYVYIGGRVLLNVSLCPCIARKANILLSILLRIDFDTFVGTIRGLHFLKKSMIPSRCVAKKIVLFETF